MQRSTRPGGILKYYSRRRGKALLLAAAALPIFQTTGCYPDLISALSFELQWLVNNAVINAANILIQNILGL